MRSCGEEHGHHWLAPEGPQGEQGCTVNDGCGLQPEGEGRHRALMALLQA